MKNISVFFSALVALLFSVAETSAQITPPYYNPANVAITGGAINGATVGETTPANATASRLRLGASNDLYLTRHAAKQVMISGDGIGDTTNAGIIAGYYGSSGNSAIWSSAFTPTAANYILFLSNTAVTLNGGTSSNLNVANNNKLSATAALTTSINPLSVTDTTDSSSTTTGSLKTAGGLGVAKKSYFGGATTTSAASLNLVNDDPAIRFKWTATPTADKNTFEIRTVGVVGNEYLQFRTVNDALTVFTNKMNLWNSGGLYLGVTPIDPGAGSFQTDGALTVGGNVIFGKTITTAGTTGAQTINKTTGRVNFAAAATSLVVTNSLTTANSICHVTIATNDATAANEKCVTTAGSFTIYLGVAPTAETAVNFTITN